MMELKEFQKVVLYPKDTEKWKQFTTDSVTKFLAQMLFCIPKILKNESNSQQWKQLSRGFYVVLYPKDTEKWNLAKGKQGDSA